MTLEPDDRFEREAWVRGFRRVAGVDEVGRGPLAGPVVAAAVILHRRCRLETLRDSKLLTEEQRERLFACIVKMAVGIGVGVVDAPTIDAQNILKATRIAMGQAVSQLSPPPDYLVLDATGLPSISLEQRLVIKGDGLCLCVAAASIIAKVTRDRLMVEAHVRFPGYGFGTHKGYGTKEHLRQLRRLGPCELHRQSFRGVRELAGR